MTEHRNPIAPSVLLRMAASMETLKDSWDADVHELRRQEGVIVSLNAEVTRLSDRCDGLVISERTERERNEFLVRRNAVLEAQVQRFRDSAADARDALDANVNRIEQAAVATPREQQPDPDEAQVKEPTAAATTSAARLAAIAPDLPADLEDGGPDHIPVFLARPNESGRTRLPPNEFGKRHAMAAE